MSWGLPWAFLKSSNFTQSKLFHNGPSFFIIFDKIFATLCEGKCIAKTSCIVLYKGNPRKLLILSNEVMTYCAGQRQANQEQAKYVAYSHCSAILKTIILNWCSLLQSTFLNIIYLESLLKRGVVFWTI